MAADAQVAADDARVAADLKLAEVAKVAPLLLSVDSSHMKTLIVYKLGSINFATQDEFYQ